MAADGSWTATFVIPPFVGGMAMTRGSAGADVTPGTWQFGVPGGCGAPDAFVNFQVTGTAPTSSRVIGIARTPDGKGYWLVGADGGVFAFGDAPYDGNTAGPGVLSTTTIVPSPDRHGDALFAATIPAVANFGDSALPQQPAIAMSALPVGGGSTPDGKGYWEAANDGGVFAFGDAQYYGSLTSN